MHPWKCRNGHENVTEIPEGARSGPRRRFVLKCPVEGCAARSWIFVGSTPGPIASSTKPRG